jgi:hypothetical protein
VNCYGWLDVAGKPRELQIDKALAGREFSRHGGRQNFSTASCPQRRVTVGSRPRATI